MEAYVIRKKPSRAKSVKPERNGKAALHRQKIATTIAKLDQLSSVSPKTARTIALLKEWLSDESGYDEQTWPQLKVGLDRERRRLGARRLFDG
jgi:hypothetical protein